MKTIDGVAIALLCLAGSAQAAEPRVCNVTADVIDQDPHGTNVRETPGGKVIAVLQTPSDPSSSDDWIEVHIAGQTGDWFLIDRAERVGDDRKVIFRGRGYVHMSVVGSSGLQSNAELRADHDGRSPLVAGHARGDQPVRLLACWGDFAKVHVKEGVGWTKGLCLNQRTTCV